MGRGEDRERNEEGGRRGRAPLTHHSKGPQAREKTEERTRERPQRRSPLYCPLLSLSAPLLVSSFPFSPYPPASVHTDGGLAAPSPLSVSDCQRQRRHEKVSNEQRRRTEESVPLLPIIAEPNLLCLGSITPSTFSVLQCCSALSFSLSPSTPPCPHPLLTISSRLIILLC